MASARIGSRSQHLPSASHAGCLQLPPHRSLRGCDPINQFTRLAVGVGVGAGGLGLALGRASAKGRAQRARAAATTMSAW
jgi:hypothetical protein